MRELSSTCSLPCSLDTARQRLFVEPEFIVNLIKATKQTSDVITSEWQKTGVRTWNRTVVYSSSVAVHPFLLSICKDPNEKVVVKIFETLVVMESQVAVSTRSYFENNTNVMFSTSIQLSPTKVPFTTMCTYTAKCQYAGNLLNETIESSMEGVMEKEMKCWLNAAVEYCTKSSAATAKDDVHTVQSEILESDDSQMDDLTSTISPSPPSYSQSYDVSATLSDSEQISPSDCVIQVSKNLDELRSAINNNICRVAQLERSITLLSNNLASARSQAEESDRMETISRQDLLYRAEELMARVKSQLAEDDVKLTKEDIVREARYEDLLRRLEKLRQLKRSLYGSWRYIISVCIFLSVWPFIIRILWKQYGRYILKKLFGLIDMFFGVESSSERTQRLKKVTERVGHDFLKFINRRV